MKYAPDLRKPLKVSIIIAVYNEAATVATLLDRVWAQPLPGACKEIIIVESNSTDGSREIVAQFHERHAAGLSPSVQVILEPTPMGKGRAIRQGFAAATGDIATALSPSWAIARSILRRCPSKTPSSLRS